MSDDSAERNSQGYAPGYPEGLVGVYTLSLGLYRLMSAVLREEGVFPAQVRLLHRLRACGPAGGTVTELAADVILGSKQNISANLKRLERMGLVSARRDPYDRRLKRYHPTPAGTSVLERFMPRHRRIIDELVSALDERERKELDRLMRKLTARLEEMETGGSRDVPLHT